MLGYLWYSFAGLITLLWCLQALAQALGGDAGVYLLLGMLRISKGKPQAAADAYSAAVCISVVWQFEPFCALP